MRLLLIICIIMTLFSLASLDSLQQENNKDSPFGEWQASWERDDNGTVTPLHYLLCAKVDNNLGTMQGTHLGSRRLGFIS